MFLKIYFIEFIKKLDDFLFAVLSKILFALGLLRNGYFIDDKRIPFTFRVGSKKTLWLMTARFLIKISLIPKIIGKKDCLCFSTEDIVNSFNRINPRCWDIIENSIKQKKNLKRKIYISHQLILKIIKLHMITLNV